MGVEKRETYNYFNVSRGKLRYKENGQPAEANAYTGTIVGIRERAGEYEGQPTVKVEVKLKDTESDAFAILQFTKEAIFSLGFFARIRKVDLSKPVTIGVLPSDKNDKISFCYLKQEGYNNPDPKKKGIIDKDTSFPAYKTVKVSGKDVADYTEPFKVIDEIIKHINDRFAAITPAEKPAAEAALQPTPDDDLLF